MKKIQSTEKYTLNCNELDELLREKHFTDLAPNAKITIEPEYDSYYDANVFRGLKITVVTEGE
ncbi:hypothetical protein SEPL_035 [Salmonella phage SE_PL]|uniref:hypothetical protein n=1 Tax=Salmonella enterica TaxID=28901 RepID=UPI000FDF7FA2|nr:hypothetical protein CPT_Munch_393 [Salmonella phage Munch]EAZ2022683.1 hypothetical protein [Salmonella enterica]ECV9083817.1 hypothetical protein [Salmonella enterica subsp. enterica serovar Infantis]MCP0435591.1 hypothetical protein [Salmonella enterica subsp. enterica serovar Mbandaka]QCW19096.1 hypothetical protein 7t3_0578 [Salmonella phage 7t3]QIG62648.1 hypothetical protein SEPL_035 [Salmonella phage SE_PL]WNV47499.1 hypothetical protein [Klebsiella phage fENko-Kae01]